MYGEGSNDIFQFYIFISCLKNVLSQITDLSSSNTSSSFILYDYTCVDIFSLILSRIFFNFQVRKFNSFEKLFFFLFFFFRFVWKKCSRRKARKLFVVESSHLWKYISVTLCFNHCMRRSFESVCVFCRKSI